MKRLVALPLRKSLLMAYQSIRVRFFRSLITTMSLVLAVAFLCFIQVGNDFAQSLLASGDATLRRELVVAGYDIVQVHAKTQRPDRTLSPSGNQSGHTGAVAEQPRDTGNFQLTGSAKQRWIVFLSLLVCVVGIVNAQLMSVTERFREIGTLKCLGALDRFIVRLFVLEAALQGVAGSLIGALLGIAAATTTSLLRFGVEVVYRFPLSEIGLSAALAILTGTGLSLVGVLYPALLAARMQPVEAMRVDQ